MKFSIVESDLNLLYIKARNSYEKCIHNEGNAFLKDEVNIPLNEVIIIEKCIKIVFFEKAFNEHLFEVNLLLYEKDKEIGKYLYMVNERGDEVDDSLIFY